MDRYNSKHVLLGFYKSSEDKWLGCTSQKLLIDVPVDDAVVCDTLVEAVRVLHRKYPVTTGHLEFSDVTRVTWQIGKNQFDPPKILIFPLPMQGSEMSDDEAKKCIRKYGYLVVEADSSCSARRYYPPEEGFVPCSDMWVTKYLGVGWSDDEYMVVRFDLKAARALSSRINNQGTPKTIKSLTLDDVRDLVDDVYADVKRINMPMEYDYRVYRMSTAPFTLETVIQAHELIFGKRQYRKLEAYARFIWKCYSSWERTKAKWKNEHDYLLGWIESEFRSRVATSVIRSAKNGNLPADRSYRNQGGCRLPVNSFSFARSARAQKKDNQGQEHKPRVRQLRLKFPKEKKHVAATY